MIRLAVNEDIDSITPLLREFGKESPFGEMFCPISTTRLIYLSINQGLCWVAVKEEEIVGVCLGRVSPSPWNFKLKQMDEIALYMSPEHRNSRDGFRLFNAYVAKAKDLLENKLISAAYFKTIKTSPEGAERMVERVFEQYEKGYYIK